MSGNLGVREMTRCMFHWFAQGFAVEVGGVRPVAAHFQSVAQPKAHRPQPVRRSRGRQACRHTGDAPAPPCLLNAADAGPTAQRENLAALIPVMPKAMVCKARRETELASPAEPGPAWKPHPWTIHFLIGQNL